MKNIFVCLSIIMISNIYAQCDDYNQSQCSNNNCEWVEDIEIGQCSQFDNSENSCIDYPGECFWDEDITYASCDYPNSGSCNSAAGCYWNCSDYGWYCDCYGQQQIIDTECIGQYEIDNSYCQEAEMPECSEFNQSDCNDDNYCEWVENIESGSCGSLSDSNCELTPGCLWEYGCIEMGWWYNWCYTYGYECNGGTYSYDNGYCEETENQLGDLNQDSLINIQDVILAINLILNGEFDLSADINLDSIVNVLDVIQIVNIILSN